MKRKQKPVEYKDTFNFRIFPDFNYTKTQKLRLRLFQGRVEHWRAAVNYADRFHTPQEINLLYLIGYTPKIKPYLEQHTESNLVVLCVPFTSEDLKIYDNYWELVERYRAAGFTDENGNFIPLFYEEGEENLKFRNIDATAEKMAQEYETNLGIINSYKELETYSAEYFNRMICIGKNFAKKTVSFNDINKIIKSYFPYGRERIGISDRAICSPKKVTDALQIGLNRGNAAKIFGLPADADTYTLCKKEIRRCEMNISVSLRETGTVELNSIFKSMQNPPYGWDNDIHSAYCFGYAVSKFTENAWIWDSCNIFSAKEIIETVLLNILKFGTNKKTFVLFNEKGERLTSRFAYIFDLETGKPRDETDKRILELHNIGYSERKIANEIGTMSNIAVHKRLVKMRTQIDTNLPFCAIMQQVIGKIETKTRYPVSLIDEKLQEVIRGTWNETLFCAVPIMSKQNIRETLNYFTDAHCREIKNKLDKINEYVPDLIKEKYGNVDVNFLYRNCTTQCSGWLWKPETFWECVDDTVNHKNLHRRPDGWYYNERKLPEN